jgi:hypothetical protein
MTLTNIGAGSAWKVAKITNECSRFLRFDLPMAPLPVAMDTPGVPATSSSTLGVRRMPITESINRMAMIERMWRWQYMPASGGSQHLSSFINGNV